jgi:hypothetical protein
MMFWRCLKRQTAGKPPEKWDAEPTNDKGKSAFASTYKMMFLDNKQLLLF